MTIRVKVHLSIGLVGGRDDILEFDDDTTEEDIEKAVGDWAHNYIEWGWTPLDAEDGKGSAEG